jgi:hypothetical protein
MTMSHVFSLVVELAIAAGCPQPLRSVPGCWSFTFKRGETEWQVYLNGHDEPKCGRHCDVEPFGYVIFYGEFLAATGGPHGGACIGGTEDELIEILTEAKSQFPEAAHA